MKANHPNPGTAALRGRAEARWKLQTSASREERTALETARLVQELGIHQIELEMQNEELERTRAEMDLLLAQYTDLYEDAPVGYFNLDRDGSIRHVNLAGARLLGLERSRLVNRRFGLLASEGERRAWSDFLSRILSNQTKASCELTLPMEGSQPVVVQIEGTPSADGLECRMVVQNITERKQAEEKLQRRLEELQRWHNVTLGREDRVQELKREVNQLLTRLGEPIRYASQNGKAESLPPATPTEIRAGPDSPHRTDPPQP